MMSDLEVALDPVHPGNRQAVEGVWVTEEQQAFLETRSLAEFLAGGHLHPTFVSYAVRTGADVVGFVSVGHEPGQPGDAWVPLLIIDRRHQGKGLGPATMIAVIDMLTSDPLPIRSVGLAYKLGNVAAERLYQSLGFEPTGRVDEHGEIEMRLPL
jgi:diamine N-acetyltransferase